ncbi:MAG TPA: cytochrome c3 family protein [Planctomycetaceae bacterium]|nr:cytochrome c3 family protein [Planctomycetaceae bacterium]
MAFGRSASSRELANRAQIDFHRRPNRFRRLTWIVAVVCGAGALGWLSAEALRGERRIYQADRVATPHRMFENDCAQCHGGAEWQPVRRLLSLDDNNRSTTNRSVTNENCLKCHEGPEHHAGQLPAHESLSCAWCHREHEGDESLAWVSDSHCVSCHSDLRKLTGPSEGYVRRIEGFDLPQEQGGHPEFAVHRLLTLDSREPPKGEPTGLVYDGNPIDFFQREGEAVTRWQDSGRIRFNHKVHLHVVKDENGEIVEGLLGPDRKLRDYSNNCIACHEFDAGRRYMQPINYEKHCASCHPLYFDVNQHAGLTVPHETPDLVRGYLTELYTLQALSQPAGADGGAADAVPQRPLPGRSSREKLSDAQASEVQSRVAAAEQAVLDHTHRLLALEGTAGGCRYCHEIVPGDAPGAYNWKVVPPNIPDRWYKHSVFRHDSHRMLGCTECHKNAADGTSVLESSSTGDVLVPKIEVCLQCHTRSRDSQDRAWSRFGGARTDCVECHVYHDHSQENFNGPLTISFEPRSRDR